ncbi:MAG: methyltransferase domain-containing protein [Oxalobacteraceae bacterium]|nr:methyltransferase domain-containing protein [Oxalobacteraceae bacterium]
MKQFDQMKNVLLNALHQPRKKSLSRVICHAALALLLPIQVAQGNELSAARCQYEQIKDGHPDGIFKRYCGRQIARIMGWEGAEWLERPERKTEEGLDQLIDRLQLKPGMQVGDIGAGTGRLSILMVDRIKPDGQVWAVDVQPEMVKYLVARAAKLGKNQLNVALSSETSPNIQAAKLDLAVMVDVYHELEFPREFLRNLMKSVKPGGQVVFVPDLLPGERARLRLDRGPRGVLHGVCLERLSDSEQRRRPPCILAERCGIDARAAIGTMREVVFANGVFTVVPIPEPEPELEP